MHCYLLELGIHSPYPVVRASGIWEAIVPQNEKGKRVLKEKEIQYLDSLLNEKSRDQHAEQFPGNSCEPSDDNTGIEYSKQKQQQGSPDTYPVW